MKRTGFCVILLGIVFSCSPRIKVQENFSEIEKQFQDHTAFILYDPVDRKTLYDFNADKFFIPASNTKIFTFYSCLQLLGDSIPALRYLQKEDSLIVWGTGDPSFLYTDVFQNGRTFDFLKRSASPLYFASTNFQTEHFGPGWAWDDYYFGYSAERSPLPIYGNCVVWTDSIDGRVKASPPYFQSLMHTSSKIEEKKKIVRGVGDNQFVYSNGIDSTGYQERIPFHATHEFIASLLSDTLKRKVTPVNYTLPAEAKIYYSTPADSLYRVMMQESDNFIAEQLLLLCAGVVSDTLKPEIAIDYVKENFLFDLPDEPKWVDGSGLSRYNLFTPRAIVRLWEKIYTFVPQERLFKLLAVGGESGTIKNSYKADSPYVFGKTGTLSNVHCLSGYLKTKKGKILIFSLMSNNYTVPTSQIRGTMERVLKEAHDLY